VAKSTLFKLYFLNIQQQIPYP